MSHGRMSLRTDKLWPTPPGPTTTVRRLVQADGEADELILAGPDTGIVNFYQMNDTLMGHVDRAECVCRDRLRPQGAELTVQAGPRAAAGLHLASLFATTEGRLLTGRLGHSAVFLLGGASREIPPQPVVLRSGDVLIMSGSGRQSYHGACRLASCSAASLLMWRRCSPNHGRHPTVPLRGRRVGFC